MKRIMWISTGGTISCVQGKSGLSPAVSTCQMNDMLEAVGGFPADIKLNCIMNIDSTDISCEDIRKIGSAANDAIAAEYDGIIITHGTDTMAYTAAMLSHMLENPPVPVILTGSQKPFFADNSDGPENLRNALRAALDSRFAGVYVLFGDKIICGSKAHKQYTESFNAFISAEGYAAIISDGAFTDINTSKNKNGYRFNPDFSESVLLIKITPSTREDIFDFATRSGYKGIVIEGYGCGGIPDRLLPSIKNAADCGVKILLISQCFYEGVSMDIYEVGAKAAEIGIISGGTMTAEAAVAEMMFSV